MTTRTVGPLNVRSQDLLLVVQELSVVTVADHAVHRQHWLSLLAGCQDLFWFRGGTWVCHRLLCIITGKILFNVIMKGHLYGFLRPLGFIHCEIGFLSAEEAIAFKSETLCQ